MPEGIQGAATKAFGRPISIKELAQIHAEQVVKPQVLEAAKEVLSGTFPREAVEEVDDGFRVKDPMLLMIMRNNFIDRSAIEHSARLDLLQTLNAIGFRIGIISPDPEINPAVDKQFLSNAKFVGVKGSDIIFATPDQEAPKLSFLRDAFVQLGNTIYFAEGFGPYMWNNLFDWAKALNRNASHIGAGGEVIISEENAFVAKPYMPEEFINIHPMMKDMASLSEMMTAGEAEYTLENMGKRVFKLPNAWTDLFLPEIYEELETDKKIFMPTDHADVIVLDLYLNNAMYFGAQYYSENTDLVDRIIDEINPGIFRILPDEDGMPLCSSRLPNGGVLMDAAAKESIKILRADKIPVITTNRPWGTWAWGGQAGIDCCLNLIWLPSED